MQEFAPMHRGFFQCTVDLPCGEGKISGRLEDYLRHRKTQMSRGEWVYVRALAFSVVGYATSCLRGGRRWSSNPSGKCSCERPTRGTVCGTMRSMCGADASCLAINYQSLFEGRTWSSYAGSVEEGRCKATWKRELTLPWRKAGLLTSFR